MLVFVPFLVIAVLFAATDMLAMHRVSAIRNETTAVVTNMLTSLQLVARMRDDVRMVEKLTYEHILATEPETMASIDRQMRAARDDFHETAAAFEPLATLPGEEARWQTVKFQLLRLKPTLESVLELSRRNEDAAAKLALGTLQEQLGGIFAEFRALIEMNHAGADAAVARVDALQGSSAGILELIALIGIVLSGAVGVATTRLVQRREELQLRHARMLEATNRELDAFAGRVAHDLRGPLATATLATKRLGMLMAQPDRATEVLGRALGRMAALIDDLLALSRMQLCAQEALCNPAAAAGQVRDELVARAESSDAGLALEVQSAWVRCGEGLLRQVIWNLVDNSMKYRRPDVRLQVEVRGRSIEQQYELSVRDNGVGMSPEEATQAFDPFYRALRHKGEPGTGIGLSIVKRAVEACGGTVSVRSEPGRGSTFDVRLPLA